VTAVAADTEAMVAERLELDYAQTTELVRSLSDARFKLVALVPTLSGAAVGLLGHAETAVELLAVGLLGLVATLGVLLYDLRSGELQDYATRRAQTLESAHGFSAVDGHGAGGLFSERPGRTLRLFGLLVDRERGFALVYAAALAGWAYLVAWGALRALHVADAQTVGAAIGAGVGLGLLAALVRVHRPAAER
jgi:hypothetical protein